MQSRPTSHQLALFPRKGKDFVCSVWGEGGGLIKLYRKESPLNIKVTRKS
jgi:hypothetical protein